MAIKIVQAVRQAELNAAQKEKEADLKKEAILTDAQQNSKAIITSMTRDALTKAERDLAGAQSQGIETMEAAKRKADNEVLLIKGLVQKKEQAAINLVLSNVI